MTTKTAAIGVWCGLPGEELLALVGLPGDAQTPVLKITLQRVRPLQPYTLIPWQSDYDSLAADVAGWFGVHHVLRTHEDERIAMRDLVAREATDLGILVYGTAATIDLAEIHLVRARAEQGIMDKPYSSSRMRCYHTEHWLLVSDTDEWVEPMSAAKLSEFYADRGLPNMLRGEARALKARRLK